MKRYITIAALTACLGVGATPLTFTADTAAVTDTDSVITIIQVVSLKDNRVSTMVVNGNASPVPVSATRQPIPTRREIPEPTHPDFPPAVSAETAVAPATTFSPVAPVDNRNLSPDELRQRLMSQKVIVGRDTVPVIVKERFNFGRYDRGLLNYLYIPRGQWMFGLTASYGELKTEDTQLLNLLKDLDLSGKLYSINPSIGYAFRNNQAVGVRFNFKKGQASLGSLAVDFDEDLNFSIHDVSYDSRSFGVTLFYRNYIGLSSMKRFGFFNEVDLSYANGSASFKRFYNDEMRDTQSRTTSVGLNFSPGVCIFIMDYVSFNVSFGVFGLHLTHEKQTTNGMEEGSRTTSGANFKFNLFNINFGIGVHI